MKKIMFVITMLTMLGSVTYADCVHEGQVYPEGTVMGPFICVNGGWVKR